MIGPVRHSPLQISAEEARKVIILGAGASAADGAPLQSNLFRKYAEIIRDPENVRVHDTRESELRTLFYLMWGVDIDRAHLEGEFFPTFEEVLGLLELANTRGEFFKGFGGLQQEATRGHTMRGHLVFLIAVVLDEALRRGSTHHPTLAGSLKRLGWLENTGFLSLNYDLLIDNSLRIELGKEPDYGVKFRQTDIGDLADYIVAKTPLLKVHGSLNWLYCPTCNALDLFPGEKIVSDIAHNPGRITCDSCTEPRVPIVIPPTFFKVMSNYYLQQVWKRAEEVLTSADHIIFCGYSFPDADLHLKYLLKRAEINRREHASPPEVFIVNEHEGKQESQRRDEKERYIRFFRNKGLVRWTNLSFADFAADPERYAKEESWA